MASEETIYTWLELGEILGLLAFTGVLVGNYASKSVPFYITGLSIIAWFISFAGVVLLPYDVYLVLKTKSECRNWLGLLEEMSLQWEIDHSWDRNGFGKP